ncbi:MAG: DNA cytosine methyltransferase [Nocardioidaceae bacterium]|nr:DNA cytosine methyltransferase [Nocardioidaceae bacterium]
MRFHSWFCGVGGDGAGARRVPGVRVVFGANHAKVAVLSHTANFPDARHWRGDIRDAPVQRWPVAEIFWASPSCPPWTDARGVKRNFHNTRQGEFDLGLSELSKTAKQEEEERARALMNEVPQYLAGVQARGGLVLAGVTENVVQCRKWDEWDRWIGDIRNLGYKVRVIAFNSMHADAPRSPRAPQSRDRLYVAYWHEFLGRDPDWDKWLRPRAWCPTCDEMVDALQVFKKPGVDMGRYGKYGQYQYRCPRTTCRNAVVEPEVLPAWAAIDWTLRGTPIGQRSEAGLTPLVDNTLARIRAGIRKFARPYAGGQAGGDVMVPPLLVPSGGTWRDDAVPLSAPMPTRTTSESDALVVPPVRIPAPGHRASEAAAPVVGQAVLPLVVPLRGGGDAEKCRPVDEPLHTVTAGGNHHYVASVPVTVSAPATTARAAFVMRNNGSKGDGAEHCTTVAEPLRTLTTAGHQTLIEFDPSALALLVPYYGNGAARRVSAPVGTVTTVDRWALTVPPPGSVDIDASGIDLDDVLYRMLTPAEIGRAMAFTADYTVKGNQRQQVRQYGNAVTPPVAELLVSALVEAIEGTELPRYRAEVSA